MNTLITNILLDNELVAENVRIYYEEYEYPWTDLITCTGSILFNDIRTPYELLDKRKPVTAKIDNNRIAHIILTHVYEEDADIQIINITQD